MSLLDRRAPHSVEVQNYRYERDEKGRRVRVAVGGPIPVRVMGEPVRDWSSSEEERANGLQILDLFILRSRHWPGDVHSIVNYDGHLYETVGSPQYHGTGRRTRHWRITLRKQMEA